ncbi:MAG: hypothetical protein LBP56_07905 [Odoribacteraceae bacterium]|jgi:hypothetical protein|nr:hypothetical protein [Odoribacteraceae bacterium]
MNKNITRGILATLLAILATFTFSCGDRVIGYLDVENAEYIPDSLEIPRYADLDPVMDATRIENNAPWVSLKIQGVRGTSPIAYAIAGAREKGGKSVAKFLEELSVAGAGVFHFPLQHETPAGEYTVSLRVYNEGHDKVVPDAFTFIVK